MSGHNNYKLKEGWLSKGIRLIETNPRGFAERDAETVLGVSRAMSESIKFWMQATGVAKSGHGGMKFTEFGEIVREKDRYLEEELTVYLLHRNLITGGKFAAATEYFNGSLQEASREELAKWLTEKLAISGAGVQTALGETAMLIQTYAGIRAGDPEDNNYCQLSDLHLVKRDHAVIRKTMPNLKTFPEKLLLLEMEDLAGKENGCSASKLSERVKAYYNLPWHVCYDMAHRLAAADYVTFVRTAGIDQIYKKNFPKNMLHFLYENIG